MLTPLTSQLSQSFPRNFWLGLAMAASLWALLGLGTAIS